MENNLVKLLVAFVIAAAMLAAEHALASRCRSILWGGLIPILATVGTIVLFVFGPIPANLSNLFPFLVLNIMLWEMWFNAIDRRKKTAPDEKK